MNKKIILFAVFMFLMVIPIYYRQIKVDKLINPYTSKNLPDKIDTYIYFSVHSTKELKVTGQESIKEIVALLTNMKVQKQFIAPKSYSPKLKETYQLVLCDNNDEKNHIYICIYNSKYIKINNKIYKIIDAGNLSGIYNSVVMDQQEGSLDEFYYDLIQ